MTGHRGAQGPLDLCEVARDDHLLDLLGTRAELGVWADDATVSLLRAWAADVDAGLADLLAAAAQPSPGRESAEAAGRESAEAAGRESAEAAGRESSPGMPGVGARAVRGIAVAVLAAGALSVGGVSAAVTGDPFAVVHAVGDALRSDEMPPSAAEIARWNVALRDARAAARAGDAGAAALIADLTSRLATMDLTPGQRAALERKLEALRAIEARETGPAPRTGRPARQPAADGTPGRAGTEPSGRGSGGQQVQDPVGQQRTAGTGATGGASADDADGGDTSGGRDPSGGAQDTTGEASAKRSTPPTKSTDVTSTDSTPTDSTPDDTTPDDTTPDEGTVTGTGTTRGNGRGATRR